MVKERTSAWLKKNTNCWTPTHVTHKRAQKAIKLQHKTRRKRFHPHRAGWAPDSSWTEIGRRCVEKWKKNLTFYNISPWRDLVAPFKSSSQAGKTRVFLREGEFVGVSHTTFVFRDTSDVVSPLLPCVRGSMKHPLVLVADFEKLLAEEGEETTGRIRDVDWSSGRGGRRSATHAGPLGSGRT